MRRNDSWQAFLFLGALFCAPICFVAAWAFQGALPATARFVDGRTFVVGQFVLWGLGFLAAGSALVMHVVCRQVAARWGLQLGGFFDVSVWATLFGGLALGCAAVFAVLAATRPVGIFEVAESTPWVIRYVTNAGLRNGALAASALSLAGFVVAATAGAIEAIGVVDEGGFDS